MRLASPRYRSRLVVLQCDHRQGIAAEYVRACRSLIGSNETVCRGDSIIIEDETVGIPDPLDTGPMFPGRRGWEAAGTEITVINERIRRDEIAAYGTDSSSERTCGFRPSSRHRRQREW